MVRSIWLAKWGLLGILALVSVGCMVIAGLAGHTFGAVAWAAVTLLTLLLSAVLFGERFLSVPAAVATVANVGLKLTDNFLIWLKDIRDDIAAKKIPAAPAIALATATLTAELTKAEAMPVVAQSATTATGGPVT